MRNLAELIEQYLRGILIQKKTVEVQRCDLAKMFRCAPSQINYVLETRFTFDRGFVVESKRGGGGYIRISQIQWRTSDDLPGLINKLIPKQVNEEEAEIILSRMVEENLIDPSEAQIALVLINKEFADLPEEYVDYLRAKFLKTILLVLGGRL